jgi:hypothetical protein
MKIEASCEQCINYVYDEEYEDYVCIVNLDMDEMERFMRRGVSSCPYFAFDNEYKTVNKQI